MYIIHVILIINDYDAHDNENIGMKINDNR